jgi:hypothetical protein
MNDVEKRIAQKRRAKVKERSRAPVEQGIGGDISG